MQLTAFLFDYSIPQWGQAYTAVQTKELVKSAIVEANSYKCAHPECNHYYNHPDPPMNIDRNANRKYVVIISPSSCWLVSLNLINKQ
jgi:hypothetical protein